MLASIAREGLQLMAGLFWDLGETPPDWRPRGMTEPCDLSAVEARKLIGRKRLSAIELVESCIARIEMVNPAVNAVVASCYERARSEARKATDAVMAGDDLPPLHGLPVGIKDMNHTEGLVTTYGSPIYRDHVPETDERFVAALRQAGGIILAKTNTPEFAAGGNTTNKVYGPTRNPFDLDRTSGGSSGGSAAAFGDGNAAAMFRQRYRRQPAPACDLLRAWRHYDRRSD